MKAWSLWQPWASLWLSPCKIHETRSWPLKHRGPLFVHATKHIEFESLTEELENILDSEFGGHWGMDLPRGALIGMVEIIDCVPVTEVRDASQDDVICGDWTPGRFAIRRSPTFVKFGRPIPCRGRQRNTFDVPDEIAREALAA
jgi:hypothetical protein